MARVYMVIERGPNEANYIGPFITHRKATAWAEQHSLEYDVVMLADPKTAKGQADREDERLTFEGGNV